MIIDHQVWQKTSHVQNSQILGNKGIFWPGFQQYIRKENFAYFEKICGIYKKIKGSEVLVGLYDPNLDLEAENVY